MNKQIWKYFLRFAALVVLQLLILNNVHIEGYFIPLLYIAFIIFLPFDFPRWALLVLGFALGLTIDLFSYTPGVHAGATTLLAFARISILPILSPHGDYETGSSPSAGQYGWGWFLRYTILLTLIHHIALFLIDSFTFSNIYFTLLKALSSVVITLFLLIISQVSNKSR